MTPDDRISALVLQAARRLSDACDSGEVPGAALADSSVTVELDGLADAPDLAVRPHAPALWLHRTAAGLAGGLAAVGLQNADHPWQPDIVVRPASLRRT
ncbi:hypothetical protein [Streptosporangium amethystogenes]|uniref:hypothetical protein n=1 Tax=Streptosporangium amethystogenes TaxID=2002 RepID=UPI0004CB255F|nr:hypothetical protein [Streptosporangium amethystogenes]